MYFFKLFIFNTFVELVKVINSDSCFYETFTCLKLKRLNMNVCTLRPCVIIKENKNTGIKMSRLQMF